MTEPAPGPVTQTQWRVLETVEAPVAGREPSPGRPATRRKTLRQMLLDEPARFSFDAAVSVMMQASGRSDPGRAVRFHAPTGLAFVASDISAVEPEGQRFRATTGMLGLTGPGGVLPRFYTEMANNEQRRRSTALAGFLDVLAQRPLSQFASAGIKYRPHRSAEAAAIGARATDAGAPPRATDAGAPPRATDAGAPPRDGLREALLALTGHGLPGMAERLSVGTEPLLFHAGAFAARPRSADRLAAILSDWLGQTVAVEQFAGRWLELGPDQRTALPMRGRPGRFHQLGVDAAAGSRAWDIQSHIKLVIGPLPLDAFLALLPGRPLLRQLAALTRAYLDGEVGFTINPVLAAEAMPPMAPGSATAGHLGWNTWLPVASRRDDAREAVFKPDHRQAASATTDGQLA